MNRLQERLIKAQIRRAEREQVPEVGRAGDGPGSRTNFLGQLLLGVSHLSQIGLLVLAVLGYVYTIKPVYDKAKLDQEIEQKSVELARKSAELEALAASIDAVNKEKALALEGRSRARAEAEESRRQARESLDKWSYQYAELRMQLLSRFISVASATCHRTKSLAQRVDQKFSDCALGEALQRSYLDSLTPRDLTSLKRLTVSYGARIDSIEAVHVSKGKQVEAEKALVAENYSACVEAVSKSDQFKAIDEKYRCDIARGDAMSEMFKKIYALVTSEQNEVSSEFERMHEEFAGL